MPRILNFLLCLFVAAATFNLPDPLCRADGTPITDAAQWAEHREYIKGQLEHYIYGERPEVSLVRVERGESLTDAALGLDDAVTAVNTLYYDGGRSFRVRVTAPREARGLPVIMRFESDLRYRFPIEREAVGEGRYVIAAVNATDAYPDEGEVTREHMYEAKMIMAWAVCASLTVDFLENEPYADCERLLITGHSRAGKAALCAAAFDERFAVCVPNSSGAAGASGLRAFGDKGSQGIGIASDEPTWVSDKLAKYEKCPERLPVDMNFARALVAPRVLMCTESRDGAESAWAGIGSGFAMFASSGRVYELLGASENNLISIRPGVHDQTREDYALLLRLADNVFYGEEFDRGAYDGSDYSPKPNALTLWLITKPGRICQCRNTTGSTP